MRLEDCGRGDHRLSSNQQHDLFNDLEAELDHLAINLGGVSLIDKLAKDTRSEDEKLIDSLSGKANTFFFARDFQAGLKVLQTMTTLKPNDATSWNNKGIALGVLGRHKEAIKAYEKAIEIKPDYDLAWLYNGIVLEELGQDEKAIVAYEKAMEIFKKTAPPLADLTQEKLATIKAKLN